MFRRAVYALACVLALSLPAAAQEQTGQISGSVKDTSGAVLPGVTVEALSLATGAVASSVVTDGSGAYRFPGLRPGKYEISAKLQGFTTAKSAPVDLRLGQLLTVELALAVGGVAETVSVTAESPLIDTKQNARQSNIRDEQIALLPHGRDFTSLVTQAPGANSESKLGGLSIDGASAGENRYIIDGIETTDLQDGTSGKNLNVGPRRRSPGQVERLHGGVWRRDGRRDQHGHEERQQRLSRDGGRAVPGQPDLGWLVAGSRQRDQRVGPHRLLDGRAESPHLA